MALAFKLGTLTLRTLAKPVATRIQEWVLGHPVSRERFLRLAQYLHRMEVAISRRAEGKEGRSFVGKMTEEKAMDYASKIVSEGFVYSVGAGLVLYEYTSSKKKEASKVMAKEKRRQEEIERARQQRQELLEENERQNRLLSDLKTRLEAIEAELAAQRSKRNTKLWGLVP